MPIDKLVIIEKEETVDGYELNTWFASEVTQYLDSLINQLERAILQLKAMKKE